MNRLDQLLAEWEPALRKAFLDAIANTADGVDVVKLIEMLESRNIDGAMKAVGLDPSAWRGYVGVFSDAFEAGGLFGEVAIPILRDAAGFRVEVKFDVRNPAAEVWLKDYSSQFVTEVVDDQRTMIQGFLEKGMEKGDNPRTTALELVGRIDAKTGRRAGGAIGLTSAQGKWVDAYAAEIADPATASEALSRKLRDKRFDPTIRKSAKTGAPIPAEKRAAMVTAYRNRALKYRADTIARTESLTALNTGSHDAMRQGIEAGHMAAGEVVKVWRTALDSRVRESHQAMEKQTVPWNADFVTPSGVHLKHPGDPNGPPEEVINCRCIAEYNVDFLSRLRRAA